MDTTNNHGKATLDASIVPLNQSTPEKRTKVHILRGLLFNTLHAVDMLMRQHAWTLWRYKRVNASRLPRYTVRACPGDLRPIEC